LAEFRDVEKLWSTVEPQNLVENAYPVLVEEFEDSKKPKNRKKKKNPVDEIDNLLKNVSITGPSKSKKSKKLHTLDDFVVKASTPKKVVQNCSFSLDQSNFGDENDLDVSDIVDKIIDKKVPPYVPENLGKLGLKLTDEECNIDCSFFVDEMVENDLFEKTFREYCVSSGEFDSDENTAVTNK
jgi:hypothetical protein